ncbi:DUF2460 domain-containing protein [Sphingomonas sp.]|jgi:uncharacterized protein (TIGR02217 family)|uniref:DUF2460 domain-containing protein n=1 Tax=Sphingomonas sp. TaxID=28214 RepID=UPI002E312981|nr:DUF2460 domain-containing protein [Sphingomonas sp.]HEX4695724.1 DUF2460 domain-containing protein [Sphingomonas sp.]
MPYWLATERTVQADSVISRFDPVCWTVDFPRPMMAAVTTPAADALRVDAVFYRADDLAGLIWHAEDAIDHALLRYDAARDFRQCRLSFGWRSSGVMPLDAVNGPTLTIEGRDAGGAARTWYVRLWNYAAGDPEDAQVALDFAEVAGGFVLPDEADPVWAGDIERMFVSLTAPGYTGTPGDLAAPIEAWVELTGMACDGPGSVLGVGDVVVPEHGLGIATSYDDCYNLTPARVLRNALQLGYRGAINHYVGMSHYFRLEANSGGYYASLSGGAINVAAAAWHRDFAVRAKALGYELIWSLSYELLDQHCWGDWKQRAADGSPAQTGYDPPSTLLSPAHSGAMGYLQQVAAAFIAIAGEAGLVKRFQVGEPWWWIDHDGRPYLYDDAAEDAFSPITIPSVRASLSTGELAMLDAAGASLAASTAALVAASGCAVSHVLAYLPGIFAPDAPEVRRMNLPLGWAPPAFDVLQLEDYAWVTGGATRLSAEARAEAGARLGYPLDQQHYLAGFATAPGDWKPIVAAAEGSGAARTIVWALPQVMRDGAVIFENGEDEVEAFDDVLFPLALGREAEVAPAFSTAIAASASGFEARTAGWAEARTSYDVGPGVRSEEDIATLLDFFRARMGPARGFRLRDPFDAVASGQAIGTGDGTTTRFALVKSYGAALRRITRPVAGSVRIAVGDVETAAFSVADGGWIELDVAPTDGAAVSASFTFDVPVRFAEDRLSVSMSTFLAGAAPSVPLVEVREA